MSIVVDASVLVAALIDSGPHGTWSEEVLANGSLLAPQWVQAEATNIFRRLERAKLITTPEANAALDDLMQLHIDLVPFEPFAERIWELRAQRDELRCVVRRHRRGARAPASHTGRNAVEIEWSGL